MTQAQTQAPRSPPSAVQTDCAPPTSPTARPLQVPPSPTGGNNKHYPSLWSRGWRPRQEPNALPALADLPALKHLTKEKTLIIILSDNYSGVTEEPRSFGKVWVKFAARRILALRPGKQVKSPTALHPHLLVHSRPQAGVWQQPSLLCN